jgi:hypothetical protein
MADSAEQRRTALAQIGARLARLEWLVRTLETTAPDLPPVPDLPRPIAPLGVRPPGAGRAALRRAAGAGWPGTPR